MDDNVHNELIENGTLQSFLRSSSMRNVVGQENAVIVTSLSKSKVRLRTVKENKGIVSQSHQTTAYKTTNNESSESYVSYDGIDDTLAKEQYTENGTLGRKYVEIVSGRSTLNKLPGNKYVEQEFIINDNKRNSTRSAYQFYKAAGDWWNVFPKTDYTYSKSSSCRKEIAPGIQTMPNMSRSPLRSSLGRKSTKFSTSEQNYKRYSSSDECTDSASRTALVENKSFAIRIITTIWHFLSSVFSILTLTKYNLGFESTPTKNQNLYHISQKRTYSWYKYLEIMCYQSACYFFLMDTWILSLFRSSRNGYKYTDGKRHSKLLFLLLIPPLLMAGFWYNSSSISALATLSSTLAGVKHLLPSFFEQKTDTLVLGQHDTQIIGQHTAVTLEDDNTDILVQKILSSSEFKNILLMQDFRNREQQKNQEMAIVSAVKVEQEKFKAGLDRKSELLMEQGKVLMEQQERNERLMLEHSAMKNQIEHLELQMKSLQAHHLHLTRKVGDCRKIIISTIPGIEIEKHVTNFLSGLFDKAHGQTNSAENIKIWIKSLLRAKDNLEQHLANITVVMNKKIEEATTRSADTIMASISDMMKEEFVKQEAKLNAAAGSYVKVNEKTVSQDPCCDGCTLSLDKVKEIVNNALHLYDADKTGMVDYALESAGGTVISIRCTENYNDKSLALAFLGMTFPWSSNHPRIALQPEVHPGKCWAFRGARGYLVVRLAKTIKISAVSIEHIPASISHTGNIDAAPKNFSVLGLNNETDHDPVLLGKYMYQKAGPPLQIFPVQKEDASSYQIVELVIESNHGNLEYTCLYRFRVHGIVVV